MGDNEDQGLRERLSEFVRYRREHLKGDEKGEAQIFNDALFRAFGHAGVRQAGDDLLTQLYALNLDLAAAESVTVRGRVQSRSLCPPHKNREFERLTPP